MTRSIITPFVALAEKVIATWIQSYAALLLVAETFDFDAFTAAGVAAIPAALTVVANGLPGVPVGLPYWVDLGLRTVRTYVVSFLGLLVAAPVFELDVSLAASAAVGAIPAALAIIKGGIASRFGDHDSAALLPASFDTSHGVLGAVPTTR